MIVLIGITLVDIIIKVVNIYKYKDFNKEQIKIEKLINTMSKKQLGQFYTTNSDYILSGLDLPITKESDIIEPFSGNGDLIRWIKNKYKYSSIVSFDIDPKFPETIQQDTLLNPPNYNDSWVITNPPYLARNKCKNKEIFDLYETNDLYKCFLNSIRNCNGGIIIIPAGFFFSPRTLDLKCRQDFMERFKITKVNYFEETVFNDTNTTVVAFSFIKSTCTLQSQDTLWEHFPSRELKMFNMNKENNWIIGGDIYNLIIPNNDINIRRHVHGSSLKENEQLTFMTLVALDSGTSHGRICLSYKENYVYPAKDCSRTFATLKISGIVLSSQDQKRLCQEFNSFIEQKRKETWSLFLPQYRESKEYARKRIPFRLAYQILLYIIHQVFYSTN